MICVWPWKGLGARKRWEWEQIRDSMSECQLGLDNDSVHYKETPGKQQDYRIEVGLFGNFYQFGREEK